LQTHNQDQAKGYDSDRSLFHNAMFSSFQNIKIL
jgi:hypothetical protein